MRSITRRLFMALPCISSLLRLSTKKAPPSEYDYVWDVGLYGTPWTDDPRFPFLGWASRSPDVYLDGVCVNGSITRCHSGSNGWVERVVKRNGHLVLNVDGTGIARFRVHGCVEVHGRSIAPGH